MLTKVGVQTAVIATPDPMIVAMSRSIFPRPLRIVRDAIHTDEKTIAIFERIFAPNAFIFFYLLFSSYFMILAVTGFPYFTH